MPEKCLWLINESMAKPTTEMMVNAEAIESSETNANFCNEELLNVLDSTMRNLNAICTDQCLSLKRRINPFAIIGKAKFTTRTTVKAANLDSLIKFTNPLDNRAEEFLYTDLYGDRDGFVEYIEWRMRDQKQLTRKFNMPEEYAKKMDITDPEVMGKFVNYVRTSGGDKGLHLVALEFYPINYKGELSVEDECRQWSLSYCVLALSLLRPNGNFIMKMFKSLTPFTVGLLYLMYRCFGKLTIVKPNSCGAHSAERYLVCKWKLAHSHTDIVRQFLIETNDRMNDKKRIDWLVPMEVLQADKTFFEFIRNGNVELTQRILLCWQRMLDLQQLDSTTLKDPRANNLRRRCFQLWDI